MPIPNEEIAQFKEGQSGNPNGRPKGSRNRSTVAREVLQTVINVQAIKSKAVRQAIENLGFTNEVDIETLITAAQAITALKGNTLAYQALMDSAHGKPKTTIEHDVMTPIERLEIVRTTKHEGQ